VFSFGCHCYLLNSQQVVSLSLNVTLFVPNKFTTKIHTEYADCVKMLRWIFIPFIITFRRLLVVHLSTGTSACSAGKFYCRNLGSKPQFIVSSHVNDRFCGKHFSCIFFVYDYLSKFLVQACFLHFSKSKEWTRDLIP